MSINTSTMSIDDLYKSLNVQLKDLCFSNGKVTFTNKRTGQVKEYSIRKLKNEKSKELEKLFTTAAELTKKLNTISNSQLLISDSAPGDYKKIQETLQSVVTLKEHYNIVNKPASSFKKFVYAIRDILFPHIYLDTIIQKKDVDSLKDKINMLLQRMHQPVNQNSNSLNNVPGRVISSIHLTDPQEPLADEKNLPSSKKEISSSISVGNPQVEGHSPPPSERADSIDLGYSETSPQRADSIDLESPKTSPEKEESIDLGELFYSPSEQNREKNQVSSDELEPTIFYDLFLPLPDQTIEDSKLVALEKQRNETLQSFTDNGWIKKSRIDHTPSNSWYLIPEIANSHNFLLIIGGVNEVSVTLESHGNVSYNGAIQTIEEVIQKIVSDESVISSFEPLTQVCQRNKQIIDSIIHAFSLQDARMLTKEASLLLPPRVTYIAEFSSSSFKVVSVEENKQVSEKNYEICQETGLVLFENKAIDVSLIESALVSQKKIEEIALHKLVIPKYRNLENLDQSIIKWAEKLKNMPFYMLWTNQLGNPFCTVIHPEQGPVQQQFELHFDLSTLSWKDKSGQALFSWDSLSAKFTAVSEKLPPSYLFQNEVVAQQYKDGINAIRNSEYFSLLNREKIINKLLPIYSSKISIPDAGVCAFFIDEGTVYIAKMTKVSEEPIFTEIPREKLLELPTGKSVEEIIGVGDSLSLKEYELKNRQFLNECTEGYRAQIRSLAEKSKDKTKETLKALIRSLDNDAIGAFIINVPISGYFWKSEDVTKSFTLSYVDKDLTVKEVLLRPTPAGVSITSIPQNEEKSYESLLELQKDLGLVDLGEVERKSDEKEAVIQRTAQILKGWCSKEIAEWNVDRKLTEYQEKLGENANGAILFWVSNPSDDAFSEYSCACIKSVREKNNEKEEMVQTVIKYKLDIRSQPGEIIFTKDPLISFPVTVDNMDEGSIDLLNNIAQYLQPSLPTYTCDRLDDKVQLVDERIHDILIESKDAGAEPLLKLNTYISFDKENSIGSYTFEFKQMKESGALSDVQLHYFMGEYENSEATGTRKPIIHTVALDIQTIPGKICIANKIFDDFEAVKKEYAITKNPSQSSNDLYSLLEKARIFRCNGFYRENIISAKSAQQSLESLCSITPEVSPPLCWLVRLSSDSEAQVGFLASYIHPFTAKLSELNGKFWDTYNSVVPSFMQANRQQVDYTISILRKIGDDTKYTTEFSDHPISIQLDKKNQVTGYSIVTADGSHFSTIAEAVHYLSFPDERPTKNELEELQNYSYDSVKMQVDKSLQKKKVQLKETASTIQQTIKPQLNERDEN